MPTTFGAESRRGLRRRRPALPDRVGRHRYTIDEAEVVYRGRCPACTATP